MFDEIVEPRTSKLKRYSVFASIFYLGLGAFELVKYRSTHSSDHATTGALWLVTGMLWAYRFRHAGEPRIIKLQINPSTEPDNDES
jgi:hypothetical protein